MKKNLLMAIGFIFAMQSPVFAETKRQAEKEANEQKAQELAAQQERRAQYDAEKKKKLEQEDKQRKDCTAKGGRYSALPSNVYLDPSKSKCCYDVGGCKSFPL